MRFAAMLLYASVLLSAQTDTPTATPDFATTQKLLNEVRQLRQDLQGATATIQRVQIVMYRLQSQALLLDKTRAAAEQSRSECKLLKAEQSRKAQQLEQMEARLRKTRDSEEQKQLDEIIFSLKLTGDWTGANQQQCEAEQSEAEIRARNEEARMNDLEGQLQKLDDLLARTSTAHEGR